MSVFHANLQKVTKTSLHSLQDNDQVRGCGSGSLGDGTCPDNGSPPRLCLHPGPLNHMGITMRRRIDNNEEEENAENNDK